MTILRCITIYPEWVYAILYLGKRIENRGKAWKQQKLIGQWIGIHGGKNIGGIPPTSKGLFTDRHMQAGQSMLTMAEVAGVKVEKRPTIDDVLACRGIAAIGKVAGFKDGPPEGWYIGSPDIGIEFSEMVKLEKPVAYVGKQGLWPVAQADMPWIAGRLPADAPAELMQMFW